MSARSLLALLAFLAADRRSAIRSWCPRSRSTRSRSARASPAPSCCCYGAILDPEGTPRRASPTTSSSCSRGRPSRSWCARRPRSSGIWINADSTAFRSAPSFFAVASSRPIARDRRRPHRGDLRARARLPAALADRRDRPGRADPLHHAGWSTCGSAKGSTTRTGEGVTISERRALPGAHRGAVERGHRHATPRRRSPSPTGG